MKDSLNNWLSSDGNNTYVVNHPLNESSIVIELGGYDGTWVSKIQNKYNSNIFVFEPVNNFYLSLINKFKDNNKIKIYNVGVSTEDKTDTIMVMNDATSRYITNGSPEKITLRSLTNILKQIPHDMIDIIQINIEGEEYPLLDHMLSNDNLINKFKRIQIQFHEWIEDSINKRNKIRESLIDKGFVEVYNFDFVFECWENTKS